MRVEHDEEKNCKMLSEIPLKPEVLVYALRHTDYLQSWTEMRLENSIVLQKDDWMVSFRVYPGEGRTSRALFHPYKHSEDMRERTGRDYREEIDSCIEFLQEFVESFKEEDFSHLP